MVRWGGERAAEYPMVRGLTEGLLAVVFECRPQSLRKMRWTHTLIKDLAPQVLTSL
ncbi:hypothetical protein ACFYY3_15395 [Streptomyces sp. NPDC001812]|uniref:hypothetical protein n=1 Tax=Streptomyces sp. NPDC001812 TaxID=3364611 RepID=UPI003682533F